MAALSTKLARRDAASRERVLAPRLRQSSVPPRAVQVPRSLVPAGGATVLLVADVAGIFGLFSLAHFLRTNA